MSHLRTIVVAPYNPRWPEMFQQEAEKIKAVFGEELLAIHHIGSTAVPGLSAKPIIDIMPVVQSLDKADEFNPAMMWLDYEPMGENGISGRRYFRKGGDVHRTHQVHIFQTGNVEVSRHLDFRDYLIAHSDVARQYADLKTELARQFPHNIEAYMAGKDAFIKETLQKAQAWKAEAKG